MKNPKYLIGLGTSTKPENGLPARLTVVYFPKALDGEIEDPDEPSVLVETWQDGESTGPTLPPQQMLAYRPYVSRRGISDRSPGTTFEQEPAGWFERRCAEANCLWFLPLVERMARGERVPLLEIQAAYRMHNHGKEMPSGHLGVPFECGNQ